MPGSELRVLKVLKILKEEITRVYAFLFWGRGGGGAEKHHFWPLFGKMIRSQSDGQQMFFWIVKQFMCSAWGRRKILRDKPK